jgi:formylmethanofuran dehydrogenase subunit E
MSEFIRCDHCGELSSYENISYEYNTHLCSSCQDEKEYLLQQK